MASWACGTGTRSRDAGPRVGEMAATIKACGANRLDRKRGDEAAAPRGTLVAMLCESSSSYSPSSYSTSLMSGDKAGQRLRPVAKGAVAAFRPDRPPCRGERVGATV
jgi:hypothetical protein